MEKVVLLYLYSFVVFFMDVNFICKFEFQKDRNEVMGCVID